MELAKVASEVKAGDIKVLFVKRLVYWTRFFIIATAFSRPQIEAIGYFSKYHTMQLIMFLTGLLYLASYFVSGRELEILPKNSTVDFQQGTTNPIHGHY